MATTYRPAMYKKVASIPLESNNIPAMSGDAAARANLEKENTPSVLATTPSPITSKAPAVKIGWSLKRNIHNSAITTINPIPSPKGTSRAVKTASPSMPGTSTNFLPKRSDK